MEMQTITAIGKMLLHTVIPPLVELYNNITTHLTLYVFVVINGSKSQNQSVNNYLEQIKSNWYWLVGIAAVPGCFITFGTELSSDKRMNLVFAALFLTASYTIFKMLIPDFSLKWALARQGLKQQLGRLFYATALILIILGACNYFRFDKTNLTELKDYYDLSYYYTNAKYFDELGYANLYPAMLVADAEGRNRYTKIKRYRDLTDYKMRPRQDALDMADKIKSRFSPERWESFKRDIATIDKLWKHSNWNYFFSDHGYNPPPTWTVLGKLIAGAIPVDWLKLGTSIDIVLVLLMFGVVFWAFGLDAFIFASLFFVCTKSGYWPMVGQALLRFDWLATTVIGMALFHKKRYALSGGCLAYAALVRVFPAIFFFPFLVEIARQLVVPGKVQKRFVRFIAGAAIVSIVLIGTALADFGFGAFVEAKDKILMHSGPNSYSSYRVGLGDAMVYHGEENRLEMNIRGGISGKAEQIRERGIYTKILGLASLVLIAALILRTRIDVSFFVPLGVLTLFIVTTPQINYFNVRILLFLWHIVWFKPLRSFVGLGLLFMTEAIAHHYSGHVSTYAMTSQTSSCLTVYFVFIVLSFAVELVGARFEVAQSITRRFVSYAIVALMLVVAAVPQMLYRSHEDQSNIPQTVKYARVARLKPAGFKADDPSNISFGSGGLMIELSSVIKAKQVSVAIGGNKQYRVEFYRLGNPVCVKWLSARRTKDQGLGVYKIKPVAGAVRRGYDQIRVVPQIPQGRHHLGHLVVEE
jgi:hypothetical protein